MRADGRNIGERGEAEIQGQRKQRGDKSDHIAETGDRPEVSAQTAESIQAKDCEKSEASNESETSVKSEARLESTATTRPSEAFRERRSEGSDVGQRQKTTAIK